MPFAQPPEPFDATDEQLATFVADAEVPALLAAVAHITGDLSVLREDLRPDPAGVMLPQGGLSPDQLEAGRRLAVERLSRYRDEGCPPVDVPDEATLAAIIEWLCGGPDTERYVPLFVEELAPLGHDMRAPRWRLEETPAGRSGRRMRVAVVGAGMSGLLAAHRLDQAGIDFVVYEKNPDVGGTWFENTYPGCRVDVANHLYSYSCAQRDDWPQHFSTQDVLLEYFRTCAEAWGLRGRIRFNTEVTALRWSDEHGTWTVESAGPDGTSTEVFDAVICAVGQLNRPKLPDIEGLERFRGPWFHSARWDHDVDLTGKRVAVIGTGASAVQFVPEIVDDVGELVLFQRTPPWLAPTPEYHDEVPPGQQWLLRHVPTYSQWYRLWLFWKYSDGILDSVRVDPDWEVSEESVSAANNMVRMMLTAYLQAELADAPEILERVIPAYPPGAKRMLRDNGTWPRTLKHPNLRLCCDRIVRITEQGVVTVDADGNETTHEVDVIIYGTGFAASRFLTPMKVTGRGGADLHATWDGDARAYLGITVPGFPNLFLLYGPNTNIVVNGSIIFFSELEVRYTLECLRLLAERGAVALEPRAEVHEAYNRRIDEGNRSMAWGVSKVNAWYKNERGRVTQNWPFTLREYWEATREVNPDDYLIWESTPIGAVAPAAAG